MAADSSALDPQTWITAAGTILGGAIVYCVQVLRGRKSPEPTKELVLDRADPVDYETVKQLVEMLKEGLREWAEIKDDSAQIRRATEAMQRQLERLETQVSKMDEKARLDEARRQGREDAERDRRDRARE